MKTHAIEWFQKDLPGGTALQGSARTLNRALCQATKVFTALVPALAIIVGAVWAVTVPGLGQYLQASLWASGFVFLALALDSTKPTVGWPLATGIALPVLALLSSRVAIEFAIVAALVVAVWVATSILRR